MSSRDRHEKTGSRGGLCLSPWLSGPSSVGCFELRGLLEVKMGPKTGPVVPLLRSLVGVGLNPDPNPKVLVRRRDGRS